MGSLVTAIPRVRSLSMTRKLNARPGEAIIVAARQAEAVRRAKPAKRAGVGGRIDRALYALAVAKNAYDDLLATCRDLGPWKT
jgi:hypothetical protein